MLSSVQADKIKQARPKVEATPDFRWLFRFQCHCKRKWNCSGRDHFFAVKKQRHREYFKRFSQNLIYQINPLSLSKYNLPSNNLQHPISPFGQIFQTKEYAGQIFQILQTSSQSEKRLTINFRFSSAVCRARLRFLKCFIFEDFIIKIRCEIV